MYYCRCSDKTECGSYISAVKCLECNLGNLLPASPLDYTANWVCSRHEPQTTFRIVFVNMPEAWKTTSVNIHKMMKILKGMEKIWNICRWINVGNGALQSTGKRLELRIYIRRKYGAVKTRLESFVRIEERGMLEVLGKGFVKVLNTCRM